LAAATGFITFAREGGGNGTGRRAPTAGLMLSRHRFHLLPEPLAFTTGTSPEILFVDPVLTGALLVLGGFVVDPGFVTAHWHSFTQAATR
jgi:hypothetical protein